MSSFFQNIVPEPPNPILSLNQECNADSDPNKINLTLGVYRSEEGEPYVLPSVREAEDILNEMSLNHEYLVQDGLLEFDAATQRFLFGADSPLIASQQIYTIQAVAGTGAVRLGMEFLKKANPSLTFAVPVITWGNHNMILQTLEIKTTTYRYLKEDGCTFDFEGMIEDLSKLSEGTVVLMHACAHNPSGCDPSDEQWIEILNVIKRNNLFPFFDNAYQGFVSGDPEIDAFSIRTFAKEQGMTMIVACSFSKNFGLYGERVGALHVVTSSKEEVTKAASVIRAIARCLWSTCPSYGARIVAYILSDEERTKQWKTDCARMAHRISEIRQLLFEKMVEKNVKGTWKHVIIQRGMFSFTGIAKQHVIELKEKYHVYMLMDGRISLAALNHNNIDRFVDALVAVLGTN
jgi:aspartate/tyrosine/aromatic aminotransferase